MRGNAALREPHLARLDLYSCPHHVTKQHVWPQRRGIGEIAGAPKEAAIEQMRCVHFDYRDVLIYQDVRVRKRQPLFRWRGRWTIVPIMTRAPLFLLRPRRPYSLLPGRTELEPFLDRSQELEVLVLSAPRPESSHLRPEGRYRCEEIVQSTPRLHDRWAYRSA